MANWEYLYVSIASDRAGPTSILMRSQAMVVSTSDGRFDKAKMPTNPMGFLGQLGSEGWEMITVDGSPYTSIHGWFKRQR